MRKRPPRWYGWLLALCVAVGSGAFAAGSHIGVVTLGGVPVPGATVTATQGDTTVVSVSSAEGAFRLPRLTEGSWTVRVEKLGFRTVTREILVGGDAAATSEWSLKHSR